MGELIRNIKEDVEFSRYKLDDHIERIGCMFHYWASEAAEAETALERAKLLMKRTEQQEYLKAKEENPKATDAAAKAAALTSKQYVAMEDAYLEAVKKRNDLCMAEDLIKDAISRMKEEVKLFVSGYYALETGMGGTVKEKQ